MLEMLFFYDGPLSDISSSAKMDEFDLIDAGDGYTLNMQAIKKIIKDKKMRRVMTNQVKLLDNAFLWDKKSHRPKLCLQDKNDGKWKPVGRFTKKDIKNLTSLENMYTNGEFVEKAYQCTAKRVPRDLLRFRIKGGDDES